MSVLERLDDADRRVGFTRRPELVFLLIGLLAVGAGATRISLAGEDPIERVVDDPVITQEEPEAGETVRVGPPDDVPTEEYVRSREETVAALAEAEPDATTIGIASFRSYRTPAQVAEILTGRDVDARAARYLLGGADFAALASQLRGRVVLDGDVAARIREALEGAADEAREAAAELDALAATTEDPEFVELYEEDRDTFTAAAGTVEADGCACVYAVEVTGTLAALRELAAHPEVRLVDAAPPGPEQRVILEGLLPGS